MSELELRPLTPDDATSAHALVDSAFAGTRYLARAREQLDAALQFEDPEFMAVLATRGDSLSAVALFGAVAGAQRCTKLHALIGDDDEALAALAAAVVDVCTDAGERLVVAEVPADAPFVRFQHAIEASGFTECGRVGDYVAEGIALRLLVRRAS